MHEKAGRFAASEILGTAIAAYRNGADRALRPKLPEQIPAISIGQSEIAQKNVERFLLRRRRESGAYVQGNAHFMSLSAKIHFQPIGSVRLVFDDQYAKLRVAHIF